MASLLKQRLLDGMFTYPYVEVPVSPTKKLNYLVELNTEKFELRKDGSYRFYHPQNMHDDVFGQRLSRCTRQLRWVQKSLFR
jgi:hypothetical protein